jgi:hypothetical protein
MKHAAASYWVAFVISDRPAGLLKIRMHGLPGPCIGGDDKANQASGIKPKEM